MIDPEWISGIRGNPFIAEIRCAADRMPASGNLLEKVSENCLLYLILHKILKTGLEITDTVCYIIHVTAIAVVCC